MRTRTVGGFFVVLIGLMLSGATASAQDKALLDRGIKVYAAQKCSVCHSINGVGKKTGALDAPDSTLHKLSADEIRQWLVNAPEMTKKTNSTRKPVMKNYAKLPKDDIDALVAYMQSLQKKS
jgi:mono/diheme cytochrome c family protein